MKDTKKQKNIAILLGLILVFTIIWVGSSVYHSFINSTIEIPLAESIIPIEGNFDNKTIEQIKARKRVNASGDITNTLENPLGEDFETSTPTAQLEILEDEIDNGSPSGEIEL